MAITAECGPGDFTYPRGWFMVADATKVQDQPLNTRYFGEDMVIYRGKSGRVYAVSAYCPHMGTHLGRNSTSYVVQDNEHIDDLGTLPCHPQEVIDNMTDKAHLTPVHGSIDMESFLNEFDDHIIRQLLVAGHKTLMSAGGGMMTNDTWYTGPGILQSTMIGEFPSLMLICHTPVDDGVIQVWHALLVKGDGPFHKVRIWYKQFYNPRARAAEFQMRVNGVVETAGTSNAPWPDAA